MKKNSLIPIALLFTIWTQAQVGVNTATPTSTFDISAKNSTGTSNNVEGLLVPRVDRQKAQSMTAIPTSTLIYVNSVATGTTAGTTANVDAVGYYYFNDTLWTKLTPSINPTSDTSIYSNDGTLAGNRVVTQGANSLRFFPTIAHGFSVDGNTFSVDGANSRIGINTITPLRKLHINGSMQLTNELNVGGDATTIGSAGTSGQVLTSGGAANALTWENPVNIYVANGALTSNRQMNQGAFAMRFTPTINHGFSIDGATFSVDGATNRVGIGTTTPTAPLSVTTGIAGQVPVEILQPRNEVFLPGVRIAGASGPASVGQTAAIGFNPNMSQGAYPIIVGASYLTSSTGQGGADFVVATSQGGTADVKFTVKNVTGNVGMGTIDPETKLHVVSNTTSSARYYLMDSSNGTGQNFILALRNTSAMTVNNLSLLGFTNSGPGGGGANWAIGSIRTAGQVATGAQEDFYVGHSTGGGLAEMMRMKSNGNLGLGVTNPLYALDVEGVINASGNVRGATFVTTSDARLKQDIHDTSYGLNTVMALRPVEYQKKNTIQDKNYNKHEIGFLAQDIAKIIPSLVVSGTDEFKTLAVSYTELIPVLAKAIQEQQKEIIQLKSDNEKLADAVKHNQTLEKQYAGLAEQVRGMQRVLGVKKTESGNKVAVK